MNILLIFDVGIEIPMTRDLAVGPEDKIHLFSLTSKAVINSAVLEFCRKSGCEIKSINAASIINSSSDELRNKYLKLIAELPDKICRHGKNLKEIFAIDGYITFWWLSLIAEKSTYKSDAFFRLVQLDSIVNIVRTEKIDRIICSIGCKRLHKALSEYAVKKGVEYERLTNLSKNGWKDAFKNAEKIPYVKHLALLSCFMARMFLKNHSIKRKLISLNRKKHDNSLMVLTFYPNIDVSYARKGIFKNKFWSNLQEALEKENTNVTWVSHYVPNNTISFNEAMDYASGFIKNGYSIFFIEEFTTISKQLKALFRIVLSGFKFIKMERDIRKAHVIDDYNFYELFRDDWYSSFAGSTGYIGILYYMIFMSIFTKIKPTKCLYPCEMFALEKALICANKAARNGARLYAYQSATISRMLLNYFNHPLEMRGDGVYSIPRPDKVICNGQIPFGYMVESGWPSKDILIGEAIRYVYLKEHIKNRYAKKNIVLLALSISPEESSTILTLANEALRDLPGAEVWIKPHPFLDIDKVLRMAGLSERDLPFKITKESIDILLPNVRIMVSGESGVTIEALAFGCELITVNSPEWINMSPLRYEKSDIIKKVSSADELRNTVKEIISNKYESEVVKHEAMRIINDFFYLDPDSNTPSRILELLRA